MAYSELLYTGDGVVTDWAVTFDYLDQSHVAVSVDKVRTTDVGSDYTFEWIDSTTVRVRTVIGSNPVPNGLEIKVFRETPIATPAVVFGGGASLTSNNLNKNSDYLTFALQEATDANDAFTTLYLGEFNAAPSTDNDGNVLRTGALYYDIPNLVLRTWSGTTWDALENTSFAEASKIAAQAAQAAAEAAQTAAETAQTNAETAETNAVAAQVAAEAALDAFDDRYLGAKASAPTLDNDGNALLTGALYFDTTLGLMRVYNGSSWDSIDALPASEILTRLLTVDGAGSSLDADLLDGQHQSYYRNAGNLNAGTVPSARLDLASQAEAEAGSNNTKVMTPLRSSQAIAALSPSPEIYRSSVGVTPSLDTVVTWAHGLSGAPDWVQLIGEVTTAHNGYVVGDIIDLTDSGNTSGSNMGKATWWDSTNIKFIHTQSQWSYKSNPNGGQIYLSWTNIDLYVIAGRIV